MPNVEHSPLRPRSPETPKVKLNALAAESAQSVMNEGVRAYIASPKEHRDVRVNRMYGDGMLARLNGFNAQAAGVVDPAYATLAKEFEKRSPGSAERLKEICNRLKAAPPKKLGVEPSEQHAYLEYSTVNRLQQDPNKPDATPLSLYQINDKAVKADITFLEGIRRNFPEASDTIGRLIGQLNAYRFLDPKNAVKAAADRAAGPRSKMDVAGKDMGRVALTALMIGATMVFGSIAIVQLIRDKKISTAPLIYAFAAWFLMDPAMVKKFFSSDEPILQDFAEIRDVTNNGTLKQLCDRRKIGGPAWSDTVQKIYNDGHGNILDVELPTEEAAKRTARTLSPDKEVQKSLVVMMTTVDPQTGKTEFGLFVDILQKADRTEARDFVRTYIAKDCIRIGFDRTALAPVKGLTPPAS